MAKRDRGAGGTSQRRFEKGLKTKFWSLSTRRRRGIEATDVKIKD